MKNDINNLQKKKLHMKINIFEKNKNYLVFDNEHNVDFL
jgi:hypothetical protein